MSWFWLQSPLFESLKNLIDPTYKENFKKHMIFNNFYLQILKNVETSELLQVSFI